METRMTGIILAGGKSSRMGQDKGLAQLLDKTLTEWPLESLKPWVEEILISANESSYERFGYPVIKDKHTGIGPIGGILSCLEMSRNDTNILISCDTPFINSDLIKYLLDRSGDSDVTVPWFGGTKYEPLIGIYRKTILPVMRKSISQNNFKLPDLFEKVNISKVEIKGSEYFYHPHLFYNINSPEKLYRAEELVRKNMIP